MVTEQVSLPRGSAKTAPWLRHYPEWVSPTLSFPGMSAWRLLAQSARQRPKRSACSFFEQEMSYADLYSEARRFASALVGLGVAPGDRVGLLLPNVPEFLIALNGTWMAGAVSMPISPLLVAEEVTKWLCDAECRVVVALDLFASLVYDGEYQPEHLLLVSLRDRLPLWKKLPYTVARWQRNGRLAGKSAGSRSFRETVAQADPIRRPVRRRTLLPAVILPTGGTTDQSKAVVLSHRNVVANAYQVRRWVGDNRSREAVLAVLPFFHSFGLTSCVTTGLSLGATLHLQPRFDTRAVLQLIQRQRPSIFPAVPTMLAALTRRLQRTAVDLSCLRFCISGGAPLDPEMAQEFAERSASTVVEGFGLTEAGPVTHMGPLDGSARPGSIGLPLPGTDAQIVDRETGKQRLQAGQVGELILRGPQVMLGYWNDPEETARVVRQSWLFTGDLATRDDDGFFRIVDRKKDMIITGGFNVFPGEVEEVLRQFPGVEDAAVVGIPDPMRGQQVKALLVVKKGQEINHKALEQFCARHLAKYKRPRVYEEVDGDLPRNFLGKVVRRELRENGQTDAGSTANGNGTPNKQTP